MHSFDFFTNEGLVQHYYDTHYSCNRCAREFVSPAAREEHYRNSRSHWVCEPHGVDYPTCKDLYQHYESDPSHSWCTPCSKSFDTQELLDNVSQNPNLSWSLPQTTLTRL